MLVAAKPLQCDAIALSQPSAMPREKEAMSEELDWDREPRWDDRPDELERDWEQPGAAELEGDDPLCPSGNLA